MKKATILGFGMLIGLGASANGAVLAAFDNDPLIASATTAPVTSLEAGFGSTSITQGPGVGSSNNWPDSIGTRDNTSTSLATALSNDDYFTITLTPGGLVTDVDYTDFDIRLSYAAGTGTGSAALFSSASGFTAGDILDTYSLTLGGATNVEVFNTDLTGVASLQNNIGAVEFRLYYYNLSNVGSRLAIGAPFATDGLSDLSISADFTAAAIPEPSSLALIAFGSIALAFQRKRFTSSRS